MGDAIIPLTNRLAGNIAVMLAATLVTLVLAEIGLRMFAGGLAGEPVTGNQYQFYRYDPELGWSNRPGARGTFERSEFSFALNINSHGLRGPEISLEKPAGIRRIAVLGDSFTWGVGASEAELYTTLVERGLPNTQVLNFGVSGYGPLQYHLQTDKVLAFDPDVVVIAFCLGNDFIDNVFWQRYRYYKPFARLEQGAGLAIDGYPIPNVKRFPNKYDEGLVKALHDHSYLFRLLDKTVLGLVGTFANYGQKGPSISETQKEFYVRPLEDPDLDYVIRVNALLMQRIAAAYSARGIPVIVLAVPTKCELGDCFPDLKSPSGATLLALRRSLEGVPATLVDPTGELTLADYWVRDGHWRASGHRKVADRLIGAIGKLLEERAAGGGSGPAARINP